MLELAKLIYEAVGIESPRKFIVVCAIFGAVVFSGLGFLIVKGAQAKARQQIQSAPATNAPKGSGNATTSGNESPAITGSGDTVTYGQPSPPEKPKSDPAQ